MVVLLLIDAASLAAVADDDDDDRGRPLVCAFGASLRGTAQLRLLLLHVVRWHIVIELTNNFL